jgi:HSP20 family molecular chaperone IbpA
MGGIMAVRREMSDWADDLRQAFSEAGVHLRREASAGWVPPMDVVERPEGIEVILDLAGARGAVRVTVKGGVLIIAGEKRQPGPCAHGAAFGAFVRAVPLRMAFDTAGIKATLANGELRIIVPRIEDRRGREIDIPIEIL